MKRARIVALCLLSLSAIEARAEQKPQGRKAPPNYKIPAGVAFEADVEYGRAGEQSLKLDLLRPQDQGDKRLPVIVYIHGGGWQHGDKMEGHRVLSELALTGNYAAVTVNYRLSHEAIWPAAIHDCKAAIRWVRAKADKYHFDTDHIGACGGSAGAHLAAMAGTTGDRAELEGESGNPGYSSRVQCVAATCGAYDFPHFFEQTIGKDNREHAQRAVSQLLGGTPDERPEQARGASPVNYVSADDPPFLLAHGTVDQSVPFDQSVAFAAALQKAGVSVTFIRLEGAGHAGGGPEYQQRRQDFFDKHLRGRRVEISAEPIPLATAANRNS